MRLWHFKLLQYLPRQQLLSQWRECCGIAKDIAEKGTPNHILVNKIVNYPLGMFTTYTRLVRDEMTNRGYTITTKALGKYRSNISKCCDKLNNYNINETGSVKDLYKGWHDDTYLRQCLYNLEEKYICGGITDEEWSKVYAAFADFTPLVKEQ